MFLQARGYINACTLHVSIVQYRHVQRKPGDSQKFHIPKVKVLYLSCFGGAEELVYHHHDIQIPIKLLDMMCKLGFRTHPSSWL